MAKEAPLHTHQNIERRGQTIQSVDKNIEQQEFSYIVCRDVNWYKYIKKQSLVVSNKDDHLCSVT